MQAVRRCSGVAVICNERRCDRASQVFHLKLAALPDAVSWQLVALPGLAVLAGQLVQAVVAVALQLCSDLGQRGCPGRACKDAPA